MFVRIKQSGRNKYLQHCETRRKGNKVRQRVIATLGRLDELQAKGRVETLVRFLSRFSEKALLILSAKSDPKAKSMKIGSGLIFERIWIRTGIRDILVRLLDKRMFGFDVEHALKQGAKTLVGSKGYRKYIKIEKNSVSIDLDKVKTEERFDGKWVLRTNMNLPAAEVELRYKELWMVEQIFRNVKSLLLTCCREFSE